MRVKICGITCTEDARVAAAAGADALGFVFVKDSPRFVDPEEARRIIAGLPPFVCPVGVFVDETVDAVGTFCRFCGIQAAQLHGDETPEQCLDLQVRMKIPVIKAFRLKGQEDLDRMSRYRVQGYLLDTWDPSKRGGTGQPADWGLAAQACASGPILLAGGLNPENVRAACARVRPYGVDVSSGVEIAPGRKDGDRVRAFMRAVRKADGFRPESALQRNEVNGT